MNNFYTAEKHKNRIRKAVRRTVRLLIVLILTSCSILPNNPFQSTNRDGQTEEQDILIPVTRGPIASSISFVGNIRYSQSANLTWKTGGVIEKVFVKVGDSVKKGDVLAVLASDSLNASVLIAEKTMIEQRNNLEDIRESESGRMQAYVNLNAKEAALQKAKLQQEALYYPRATRRDMEIAWDKLALANLNFNYAKQDYDHLIENNTPWEGFEEEIRITNRFGWSILVSGADSRSGRERKFEDYVSTYNTLVSAYENYLWVTGEPSATDYAIAEGNVQVAQMEYDKALEEYLSYNVLPRQKDVHTAEVSLNNAETTFNQRYIIAQFDGTVTAVHAIEGYYVEKGANAIRIDDMNHIYIPISIPELDISTTMTGTDVRIKLDAIPGSTFTGHIVSIADASEISGSTAVFSALVEADHPDPRMLAGMTAEISMVTDKKENALLIPNTAISYIDGKPSVTVVDDSGKRTAEIQLGTVSGNVSEVISGNLPEGTRLVVSSITPEILSALGLDQADYLPAEENPSQFRRQNTSHDFGAETGMVPAAATETTVSPTSGTGDASEENKTPEPSMTEVPPEKTPGSRSHGRDGGESFQNTPDGQFPGRTPGGPRPQQTPTAAPAASGEKG